eukprot:11043127-Alexandrium_andersonii.AAC.1
MLVLPRRRPSKGSCREAAAESPISATSEFSLARRVRPSEAMPSSSEDHARTVADQRGCAPEGSRSTC